MSLDTGQIAAGLREAERTATPLPLLTERFPDLSWEQARQIARARDQLRLRDGDTAIGYKLGWTSAAMREALGIERPNWGTLWRSQVVSGEFDLDRLIHPKVEPELVFRSALGLAGAVTAADVAAVGGSWALGIEVVDPRWPSFEFDFLDNTADNSSCARVVVGDFEPLNSPADLTVEFGDGLTTRFGEGSNAMGDPLEAVAWLVRSLADEGHSLRAGEIVFTGGLTAPFDVEPDTVYVLAASALAPIVLQT
jgi:2-keto-4-pentenoate hydratase